MYPRDMGRFRFQARGDEELAVSRPAGRAAIVDGRDLLRASVLGRNEERRLLGLELDAVVARVRGEMAVVVEQNLLGNPLGERLADHPGLLGEVLAFEAARDNRHGCGPPSLEYIAITSLSYVT